MEQVSIYCRLHNRALPALGLCCVLISVGIQIRQIVRLHRIWDWCELGAFLAFGGWLLYLIVATRPMRWTILHGEFGIRLERDGTLLFEGPLDQLEIMEEDSGVIVFRPRGGASFEFPRRRVFQPILSRIGRFPKDEPSDA